VHTNPDKNRILMRIVLSGYSRIWRRLLPLFACVLLLVPGVAAGQNTGRITGHVSRQDDETPLAGVQVVIQETGAAEWTSTGGDYVFSNVRPGTYTLIFTLANYSTTSMVTVTAQAAATVVTKVEWPLSFVESFVVEAASRQVERAVDAPAPVTHLDADEVRRLAAQGQVPRMVAYAPGVNVVQSGLYDFNVNARGFNDMSNRRVRTFVDDRDTSQIAVMGVTNWAGVSFALDEIDSFEFVRGAGSALYGAGAFNGVMSIKTKSAIGNPGGQARITAGELGTSRFDGRHAGKLGASTYFRVIGGAQHSGDFARSRVTSVEYEGLPREVVPLAQDHVSLFYGSARVDRPLASGSLLVVEGGASHSEGHVSTTNLGRYQTEGMNQPWARGQFTTPRWRVSSALSAEDLNNSLGLSSGVGSYDNGYLLQTSADTQGSFSRGKGRFFGGLSIGRLKADSKNPAGVETIWPEAQIVNDGAVFGQTDYAFTDRVKVSGAARVEVSSLYDATFSPRGAVIVGLAPSHTLRVSVARAFKAPTIAETRLQAAVAPPLDLSAIEQAFAPALGGVRLGFEHIPVLAVGNPHLEVEQVTGLDVGYSGLIARRTLVGVTYFLNHLETFTSGLLPQVGTSLGRLNPDYGPYRPPAGVSPAVAATLQATLNAILPPGFGASLSNLEDGSPAFALLSNGNFGKARTQGLEVGVTTSLPERFRVDVNYTLFDYELTLQAPDVPILPNTPKHQASFALSYVAPRLDASIRYRWTDGFDWLSGIYAGPVPAYGLTDVQAAYLITKRVRAGVDASNLFDNEHYEMFGGDLLGRRVLAHVTTSW
jgi:outer membrane receptor protein involved in Fe transport